MALIFIASALFILSILYSIIYYERINYEFDKDILEKCAIYRKKVKKCFIASIILILMVGFLPSKNMVCWMIVDAYISSLNIEMSVDDKYKLTDTIMKRIRNDK
jgi:hypothetical protein